MYKGSKKNDETGAKATTVLTLGDYTIQFYRGNKKKNPYKLIEKIYELSRDNTSSPCEKNRDLKAIVREYME
ncbi:hypothetical protein R9X47_03695 [Wukongibacter baidiensis]|uniref:hypothetical protein n=1 Tax=Wukongibacter baidiensis TaxID=1723361 RepID=UPI003D7F3E18